MRKKISQEDFYTQKAKKENYPARSIFKLQEADKKFNLMKKEDKVLDLGCSPGSWLVYISKKIGRNGRVIGVDLNDLNASVLENVIFLKKDIFDFNEADFLEIAKKFNVVVSDLAPKTSGIKSVDNAKSLELCEKALEIASRFLIKNGNFFCKIFESKETDEFFNRVRAIFKTVERFKPRASRRESREFFIVAKGFMVK